MFKLGYYYKFIGNKNNYTWKEKELDKKWHKCVFGDENYARFEGMKYGWFWWDYRVFIESKYPPREKIKRLLNEI
jgi:hypothetical protein